MFRPDIQRALLWILDIILLPFSYGIITLYDAAFQQTSDKEVRQKQVRTPHLHYVSIADSVCPVPLSIAFTYGITFVFFSCGY